MENRAVKTAEPDYPRQNSPPKSYIHLPNFQATRHSNLPPKQTEAATLHKSNHTMAAEQRKLLEQLMGGSATSRPAQLSLSDPKVCRSYLVGTCPHDLFTNTKQDLGACPRVHNEALKVEYENLPERERQRYGFEYDYMRDLQKYIEGCNQRIEAAQQHLKKTPDEIRQTNQLVCLFPRCHPFSLDTPAN